MELRDVGAALWRQRLLAVLVLVVTGVAVAAGVAVAPRTYESTATLSAVVASDAGVTDVDRLRSTLAALADSQEVVGDVQAGLPPGQTRDVDALRRSISATWVPGTVLISITAKDSDPRTASLIANDDARALVTNDPTGAFTFTLTSPARPPVTFSSPDLLLSLLVGIVLALALATCAAVLRDRRTYTVRGAAAVEDAVRAPLLAHIYAPRDPTLQAMYAGTPAADVFRRLRISMEAEARGEPTSLVVVTGVGSGDVNAWIAANLAISLAQVGRRTLLIDGRVDREPTEPTGLEPDTPGLYEVLTGTPLASGLSPGPVERLMVLPAGTWGAGTAGHLLENTFVELAHDAAQDFDVTVVITHPLNVSDDAVVMGAAGRTILVVTDGVIRPSLLERLAGQVTSSGTRLLGAVLVGTRG